VLMTMVVGSSLDDPDFRLKVLASVPVEMMAVIKSKFLQDRSDDVHLRVSFSRERIRHSYRRAAGIIVGANKAFQGKRGFMKQAS